MGLDVKKTCPACGAATESSDACNVCGKRLATRTDPLIGVTIAGRYKIEELISDGGMGKVYRAVQIALKRQVAVKVIHDHLLEVGQIADRFFTEALATSRMNHPNVVSIFDFGQVHPLERKGFYIVMELLSGIDVAALLRRGPIPFPRIIDILVQTLAALAEAHQLGIIHRDIKPENIMLVGKRAGDLVKIIDFGIAKLAKGSGLTGANTLLGTPRYMAPEQVLGETVTAATDIYATGAVLFELLTGKPPFDAATPQAVLMKHVLDPRPDPRQVAPGREIPDDLAEVCLRAMSIDPTSRFPDADAFANALMACSSATFGDGWSGTTRGSSIPPEPKAEHYVVSGTKLTPSTSSQPLDPTIAGGDGSASCRATDLAWIATTLAEPSTVAIVLFGRVGVGRSWLLRKATANAGRNGYHLISPAPLPPPRWEIGYGALRRIIAHLASLRPTDPALVTGDRAGTDERAREGLRVVFGNELDADPNPGSARLAAMHALAWAISSALHAFSPNPVLLALDDADTMDGASLAALSELIRRIRSDRFRILMTSEVSPETSFGGSVRSRHISGISGAEAAEMLHDHPTARGLIDRTQDIEPLYVDQIRYWVTEEGSAPPPRSLVDIIEHRILRLSSRARHALQWTAVTGGFDPSSHDHPDFDRAIPKLVRAGFVHSDSTSFVTMKQRIFRRVVVASVPMAALRDIHAKVATLYESSKQPLGLRAYHAVRGRPGFDTFLLVDEVVRLRNARDNLEGAISALAMGLHAAHRLELVGDVLTAHSARVVFGKKLAALLCDCGRFAEALGIIEETLHVATEEAMPRVELLLLLVHAAACTGAHTKAEQARKNALDLAEKLGDTALCMRLSQQTLVLAAPPREALLFPAPYLAPQRPLVDFNDNFRQHAVQSPTPPPTSSGIGNG